LIYALSKDYALSGLRVGAVYTESQEVLAPLQKLNDLCQVSSITQHVVGSLWGDDGHDADSCSAGDGGWIREVEAAQQTRLAQRYSRVAAVLEEGGIPYLASGAGLFTYIDLRAWLPPATGDVASVVGDPAAHAHAVRAENEAREHVLYSSLVKTHGLLLTPGASMEAELPGFFRLVFTAANDDEFEVALDRLRQLAQAPERRLGP
jgi:aspartate/methionine/tyrosine aminotransferase